MQDTPYRREAGYALRYRDGRFRTGNGPRTDRRERLAIRRLLRSTTPAAGSWLDMPSGAGRMSGELPGPVVQVDRDPQMLLAIGEGARVCASATALPFADGAFAGALCCRLLQHIPGGPERTRILAELRRVTRGPIIVSFFDANSLLHVRRVVRRALGKNRSGRSATSRRRFAQELAAAGLRPLRWHSLRRFVAEQTFVLCEALPHTGT